MNFTYRLNGSRKSSRRKKNSARREQKCVRRQSWPKSLKTSGENSSLGLSRDPVVAAQDIVHGKPFAIDIGAFGENVYKIGMTRRLDPMDRIDELGDASVPFKFDVHAMIFSDDAPKLEAALHNAFADKKLNFVNQRREFFNVSLEEIKQVVRDNFDKSVEFVEIPPAEQYRESLLLREASEVHA